MGIQVGQNSCLGVHVGVWHILYACACVCGDGPALTCRTYHKQFRNLPQGVVLADAEIVLPRRDFDAMVSAEKPWELGQWASCGMLCVSPHKNHQACLWGASLRQAEPPPPPQCLEIQPLDPREGLIPPDPWHNSKLC
jgi:hypothetical protein